MTSKLGFVRLTAALLMLIPLSSGCALSAVRSILAGPPEVHTIIKTECPDANRVSDLAPPETVLDRINAADPAEMAWADRLDRHLDKLAACKGA